jgi:Predicted membrane protein
MLHAVRNIILNVIDFFHKPFSKWINQQTFRYLACGGSNTLFDIVLYSVSYNFIFQKQAIHLGPLTITPYIAAFLTSFPVSFPLGFILSKYIVFPQSNLHGRVQFFRYALLVAMCIFLNYIFLKLFIEWFHFYPTPAKVATAICVAVFSYISQRNFTFKVTEEAVETIIDSDENELLN